MLASSPLPAPTPSAPTACNPTGGLLSGALFQYPGAIIMTAVGVFGAKFLEDPQGWLDGLTAGGCGRRVWAQGVGAWCGRSCFHGLASAYHHCQIHRSHDNIPIACRCVGSGCGAGGICRQGNGL